MQPVLIKLNTNSIKTKAPDKVVPSSNVTQASESVVVIISHGSVPLDYPKDHFAQLMSIESMINSTSGEIYERLRAKREINELKKQNPDRKFLYAWPFTNETIITLLENQIKKYTNSK